MIAELRRKPLVDWSQLESMGTLYSFDETKASPRLVIYISAPYSKGDVCENVRRACFAGDEILERGHIPLIPHLSHLWHLISPKDWVKWLEIDIALLGRCDALLRLDGESNGADIEVKEARRLGIPVLNSIEEVPDVSTSRTNKT